MSVGKGGPLVADRERTEIEIKLTGATRDVAALRTSRLIAALGDGEAGFERLVSTYYDTADGALERLGVSLRLREEAGGRIQTLKRRGPGGATLARHEEEKALKPEEAFPARPDDASFEALLEPLAPRLAPVARTVTDRWSTMLRYKGARIEAAFDLGRAEAFDGGAVSAAGPLAEAEFELIEGEGPELFDLVGAIVDESDGRLRLGAASKAERALRLARPSGAAPPETVFSLEPRATAADAFAAALAAAAHRLADCQAAVVDARAPEGAHQMRVALRRLRAVERLFRKTVRSRETESLAARARAIAAELGPARDWDVFCDATLPSVSADLVDGGGFAALAARAQARRADAWEAAAAAITAPDFTHFLLDLQRAAHVQKWRRNAREPLSGPARRFARDALDKRLERVTSYAENLSSDADVRHALRIEIKKLRYAANLFRSLFPGGGRKRYLAALGKLQDELGAINDAAVAHRLAGEAAAGGGKAAARAAGIVTGYRAREADAAVALVAADFAALAAAPPFWRKESDAARAANDAG